MPGRRTIPVPVVVLLHFDHQSVSFDPIHRQGFQSPRHRVRGNRFALRTGLTQEDWCQTYSQQSGGMGNVVAWKVCGEYQTLWLVETSQMFSLCWVFRHFFNSKGVGNYLFEALIFKNIIFRVSKNVILKYFWNTSTVHQGQLHVYMYRKNYRIWPSTVLH